MNFVMGLFLGFFLASLILLLVIAFSVCYMPSTKRRRLLNEIEMLKEEFGVFEDIEEFQNEKTRLLAKKKDVLEDIRYCETQVKDLEKEIEQLEKDK